MPKATYPPIAEAIVIAHYRAGQLLRREVKRKGGNPTAVPASRWARLAIEHVTAHPELVAEALELVHRPSPRVPEGGEVGDGPSKIKGLGS